MLPPSLAIIGCETGALNFSSHVKDVIKKLLCVRLVLLFYLPFFLNFVRHNKEVMPHEELEKPAAIGSRVQGS